jgi:hypothetical protein
MPLLHESVEAKKFDTRMVERNVARGVINSKEADDVSKRLPDDGENAEWVNTETLAGTEEKSNGSS